MTDMICLIICKRERYEKKNFTMNNEFSKFSQTSAALDELQNALTELGVAINNKNQKFAEIKNKTELSVQKIDALIEKINKVCEKNGSGNDNN